MRSCPSVPVAKRVRTSRLRCGTGLYDLAELDSRNDGHGLEDDDGMLADLIPALDSGRGRSLLPCQTGASFRSMQRWHRLGWRKNQGHLRQVLREGSDLRQGSRVSRSGLIDHRGSRPRGGSASVGLPPTRATGSAATGPGRPHLCQQRGRCSSLRCARPPRRASRDRSAARAASAEVPESQFPHQPR